MPTVGASPDAVAVAGQPAPAASGSTTPAGEVSGVATAPIVAAGAGNIVATGGGNVIKAGSASIVASGAGNIVAQGAGNIVAQGAGNRRLLASDDDLKELPVAGAVVFARDPNTLALVPGLAPVRTDDHGAFHLVGVPAGTTLLVEVVFVGEDRAATRMLAIAKAEPTGAKPVTVSTASTLTAAEICKAAEASGSQGQITLMERVVIDAMVDAMQQALAADPGSMREAAKTVVLDVPKTGEVAIKAQETEAYYRPATLQAEAVAKKDAGLKSRTEAVTQTLAKPLDEAQKQAVAVLRPVLIPSPVATTEARPEATAEPRAAATATPTASQTTTPSRTTEATPTPAPTATTVVRATAAPTATPMPAPTRTPILSVSLAPILVVTTPAPTATPTPIITIKLPGLGLNL